MHTGTTKPLIVPACFGQFLKVRREMTPRTVACAMRVSGRKINLGPSRLLDDASNIRTSSSLARAPLGVCYN